MYTKIDLFLKKNRKDLVHESKNDEIILTQFFPAVSFILYLVVFITFMVKTYIPVIKNDVATSQITNFWVDFGLLFFSFVTDLANFGLQVPMQQVTATILSTTFSNINWIFMKIAFKMLLHSSYCKIKKFPRCWRSAKNMPIPLPNLRAIVADAGA